MGGMMHDCLQWQICIDVIVQRLGDATAAGLFKLLFGYLNGRISTVSLYALPVSIQSLAMLEKIIVV